MKNIKKSRKIIENEKKSMKNIENQKNRIEIERKTRKAVFL